METRIYSKTIISFISRLNIYAKNILQDEFKLKLNRKRFCYKNYNYPLIIVIFESDSKLGYFNSTKYTIGLNKALMYQAKSEVIKDILRHELLHYLTFINFGEDSLSLPHGEYFKMTAKMYNISKSVLLAASNINLLNNKIDNDFKSEKIISKVKKLFKLASSSNKFESEQATIKANQLLLQHNLQYLNTPSDFDETFYVKPILHVKRTSAKIHAISKILNLFMVYTVQSRNKNGVTLEVTGKKENTELAEYIGSFLDQELERLWKNAKEENQHLAGISHKTNFMRALANSYVKKMQIAQIKIASKKDLIVLHSQLDCYLNIAYKSLHDISRTSKFNQLASSCGTKAGKNLSINPALQNEIKKATLFLN